MTQGISQCVQTCRVRGISRNVFRHAVSEIEMVETVLDQERAFEIILDHEREHLKLADEVAALNED